MPQNRVKEFRERAHITQVELSRRSRIASPNLSNIERHRLVPSARVKARLARILKEDVSVLFPED
jgi:transcriptional regulator with XRE-family HTH domain